MHIRTVPYYIHTQTHRYMYTHACAHILHADAQIHVHTCMCTRVAYKRTHVQKYMHTHMHTRTQRHMRAHINARASTHLHAHIWTCTQMHAHARPCTRTSSGKTRSADVTFCRVKDPSRNTGSDLLRTSTWEVQAPPATLLQGPLSKTPLHVLSSRHLFLPVVGTAGLSEDQNSED